MFNKKHLIVFGLLAVAQMAWAQAPAAAPAPTGTIAGTVYDAQTGRPVIGAVISVDGKTDLANTTDSQGNFTIKVAPGNHELKFTADKYVSVDMNVRDVVVGEVTPASTVMSNTSMVQSIDVVDTVDSVTSTEAALLTERKLSAVVSDSISKQELSQGTAGDAAGALEKVTGVSVVADGFVYVRGLGERYSATQLNGAVVPTTEPEKRVVPLDLFPTGMIDKINIAKTYNPDLPAEFSGGLVQLQTTEMPPRTTFGISMKGGFNDATTFSPFLTHPGGASDFWGYGTGDRNMPAVAQRQRLVGGALSREELQAAGRAFSNNWEPAALTSMRPAWDWSLNGGTTIGKIGITSAFSFSNKPQYRQEEVRYLRQDIGGLGVPGIFSEYTDFREYTETARTGGVLNLAYRMNSSNKIVFRNTYTHDGEKSAREFSGLNGSIGEIMTSQRLRYIERNLFSSGVEGEHVFAGLANSILHWQFNYSNTSRDEPDLREVLRNVNGSQQTYAVNGDSGIRFFSYLQDRIYEPQVDFSIPFYKGGMAGVIKTGFRMSNRSRDFQARRFRYLLNGFQGINLALPSNQLFSAQNIQPNGLEITEFTRGTDSYDASMDIYAGYAMIDVSFGPKWRVVGGVRVEDANIFVRTIDSQIPNSVPALATLVNRDPVPAVNVIYALSQRQNLRASYSRTLSRPDFRELSPFDFTNIQGGFISTGFPGLRRTSIDNFDARWEYFPGGSQLIAASVFVKKFDSPIEQIVLAANDLRQSYRNAKSARNTGFELELRQGLASFGSFFRNWALSSNFTFVDSNIELDPTNAGILTTKNRPMVGQSRYVFNGSLQWTKAEWHSDARFFANYVSSRITDLGTFGVPDIYQQPVTTLDFVYQYTTGERGQWAYRFEAENLNNNDFHWTQGAFTQRQYRLGRTFQIGLNYSFF